MRILITGGLGFIGAHVAAELGDTHNIDILEDNTLMYEIKNGPYMGNDRDIEYILQN